MVNRRSFLKTGAAVVAAAPAVLSEFDSVSLNAEATPNPAREFPETLTSLPPRLPAIQPAALSWQQKVRRVGQTNMTEHDPAVMDVQAWADYWHTAGADVVFVSVTGILAFYPSKVPFHRHGKFLNNRDFFGECLQAAKSRGMRVVARMSPDQNWDDALAAHPEWAMRNRDASPRLNVQQPQLFSTCMFSSYMDDYVPAVMREINSLYDVDCFYTNGWPPLGSLPECYCSVCSKLPPSGTPAYWQAFNERLFQLWGRYDQIAKEKKPDSFYFANLGGNVHAGPNLDRLGKIAAWFQGDNQGRSNTDPMVWGAALQGRVCQAIRGENLATNINAAYSTGIVTWRNATKNAAESKMWMSQTLASGLVPYNHFIGAEGGRGEDRRWQPVGTEFFQWSAKHDRHFQVRRSLANIGVVMGQSTQLLYHGPSARAAGGANRGSYMNETTQGTYEMLLTGRFAFDYVHEDRMELEALQKYRVLLLPNIAMLSDKQCEQIRAYVKAGGSLMASCETGLYDENLISRKDFGLADVFGISKAGEVVGTNGNGYYARVERQHPILSGFTNTNWLPGTQNRIPVHPVESPVLTVVPGFVQYPPELAYPYVPQTQEPAVVLRESGASRCAYFPGDIERTYWLTGHGDLLQLMHNTLRWLLRGETVVSVQGNGLIEFFGWETAPGYAIHLLNYTNPNSFHGWMSTAYQLGPQSISLTLPSGVAPKTVELLRSGRTIPFQSQHQNLRFTVPSLADYEVAAITVG